MVENFHEAFDLLEDYLDLYFDNQLSKLLWFAERVKDHETKNESSKRRYQLDRLGKLLEKKFYFSQSEVDELYTALGEGINQFQDQFVKVLVKKYDDSYFFREIEDDFAKFAKELANDYNIFEFSDVETILRAEFMAELHWDCGEDGFGDAWSQLSNKLESPHLNDAQDDVRDNWTSDSIDKARYMYEKYQDEPLIHIYVLHLINTFPYTSPVE